MLKLLTGHHRRREHVARAPSPRGPRWLLALAAGLLAFVPGAARAQQSDDFNACTLDPALWSVVDPRGDATVSIIDVGSGDPKLEISIPGGVEHAPEFGNQAARVVQAVPDSDFAVEVRFDSVPTLRYQEQGILVEEGPGRFLRFEFFGSGSGTQILAASYRDGVATFPGMSAIDPPAGPLYMRVERVGDLWTQSYSYDGADWIQAASFEHVLAVATVGPHVGNEKSGGVTPAHTAVVDYFFDAADPIVPEDGAPLPLDNVLGLSSTTGGSIDADPPGPAYACNEVVTLTAVPDAGFAFDGWGNDLASAGATNPAQITMSGDRSVSAAFVFSGGPDPSGVVSDDFNACSIDTATWTFVDPIGAASAGLVGTGGVDRRLELRVPAGTPHQPGVGTTAPRLLQPVSDTDMTLEVKFSAPVVQGHQLQGIVVEESASHFVRFGFQHDGVTPVFVAATVDGVTETIETFVPLAIGSPSFLRVHREGASWTAEYSEDGAAWTQIAGFDHALSATAAGPYVGNLPPRFFPFPSATPGFAAEVDYFFSTASPVIPEDGAALPSYTLTLQESGAGTATVSPDLPSYACGEQVALTATPDPGSFFSGWSGDLSGTQSPVPLVMSSDRDVTAVFTFLNPPPVIGEIGVASSHSTGEALVTWTTDLESDSVVEYGETTAYELGSVQDATLTTSHAITLTGLASGATYHFRVRSTTAAGASAESADQSFQQNLPPGADPSGLVSDDFNTCILDAGLWQTVDPKGDSGFAILGAGSGDARLQISVPAGSNHNPWKVNESARLLQGVNDADMVIEARFDSSVDQEFQIQGIMVQEDADTWLRFDLHHDGTDVRVLAASLDAGTAFTEAVQTISPTFPVTLRVSREGDLWTYGYSEDGSSFTEVGQFTRPLAVSAVGPFAGNFDSGGVGAPAHDALVDWFFSAASPIEAEDGAPIPSEVTLDATPDGMGGIVLDPEQPSYACGAGVELTAVADPGFSFASWSGDLVTAQNPLSLSLVRDTSLTAHFVVDTTPPVLSDIALIEGSEGIQVSWSTDEPADGQVEYGLTTDYELGALSDAELTNEHEFVIQGLLPATAYHVRVSSADGLGQASFSGDLPATTGVAPGTDPSGMFSDDFNSCVVDTGLWTVVDPLGDSTVEISGAGAGDAKLHLGVPSGIEHRSEPPNNAVRLMQASNDTDFSVEVRFDSIPTGAFQEQGILVQESAGHYLRFEFYGDGVDTHVLAAIYQDGGRSFPGDSIIAPSAGPLHMRIERSGDTWTQSYSRDGASWMQAASFDHAMTVASVGPHVGNEASNGSVPGHTAVIDYFWNSASRMIPEDDGNVFGSKLLSLTTSGPGSISAAPDQSSYACGEQVTLTALPDPGFSFDGWSGDLIGTDNPDTVVMSDDRDVTASFIVDTEPPVITALDIGRSPTSAVVSVTTNEPTTVEVFYGETSSLELGSILVSVPSNQHVIVVPGLDAGVEYYIEVVVEDGASFTASSGIVTSPPAEGPVIDVFYGPEQSFGYDGQPQLAVNVLGNVSDPDGVSSLGYSLNGAAAVPLSLGPDSYRLDLPGDFNADISYGQLNEGVNQVVLRATDALGNQSVELVSLDVTTGVTTPLPHSVDWSAATAIQDVAQVVDGDWSISSGALRPNELGYDRIVAIGDLDWTDYEATIEVTFNGFEPYFLPPSNDPALGLIARWRGHTPTDTQPAVRWWPTGGFVAYRIFEGGGHKIQLWGGPAQLLDSANPSIRLAAATTYIFKVRVETLSDGSSLYRFKLYLAGDPEPAAWDVEGIEAPGTDVASGSLLLVAHHVDASFGPVTIVPLD